MKFRLRLLLVAFAVSFLLVSVLSILSIVRTSELSAHIDIVKHSYQVVNVIGDLNEDIRELDGCEYRFLVTGDSGFISGYNLATVSILKTADSFKHLTSDNGRQQDYIVRFNSDLALYFFACQQVMKSRQLGNYQSGRKELNAASARLKQMSDEEDRLLNERTAAQKVYLQLTTAFIITLGIVFILLTLILFYLLLHEFRKRLRYQAELQQKLGELAQSKRELEHIAYATSHDLQEPLRKIRILTDKWQLQYKEDITEDTRDILNRVQTAAARMQSLIGDLMILTTLNDSEKPVPSPLRDYVDNAVASMSDRICRQGARVEIEALPVISGYPDQLKMLFKNLLDNALKFTRPHVTPVISITSREADGNELGHEMHTNRRYHCITVKDNGTGFDNKMADKMFGIFRQLHTAQEGNPGKGTGLAVCQRIMSNHKGRIVAHGFPGTGATFKLYFPVGDD